MTTQRRKFTIEGELQHSPELTTEVITKNLLRAIDAKSIYVDNSLPHFITICHFSISIDAVPTPNTMTEPKPRPETVRKPFDPKKPLELRCKVPAVLMADDMRGDKPLLVRYLVPGESNETVAFYPRSGLVHEGSVIPDDCDLINIPEKHVRWVNFASNLDGYSYATEEAANADAMPSRIACVRVEFPEGEGL